MQSALKLSKEMTDSIKFKRVHRSLANQKPDKPRNIVASLTFFRILNVFVWNGSKSRVPITL
ncbi:hypothetical protein DPMN_048027 [Dreissena polymorpha]|uniref:Uncharacterized protein n=1 Tax=Dreissena polymorpha TaxID=45954 RepID=A0A9D4DAH3_DREPO|nr:hypothetical protein DPMN_048027 [Dreissena polymorpha]